MIKDWFFDHDGVIFFGLYQNGVRLKKITNLGKSCLIETTSYAEVVPIRHDFCHVILKLCQLGTTSTCHTEVCHVIIFYFIFNFIVYILGSKLCNVKN